MYAVAREGLTGWLVSDWVLMAVIRSDRDGRDQHVSHVIPPLIEPLPFN